MEYPATARPGFKVKAFFVFEFWYFFMRESPQLECYALVGSNMFILLEFSRRSNLKNYKTVLTSLEENLMRLTSLKRKLPMKLQTREILVKFWESQTGILKSNVLVKGSFDALSQVLLNVKLW